MAWTAVVRDILAKDEKVYDPRKIIGPGAVAIVETVKVKMEEFGSVGKASEHL